MSTDTVVLLRPYVVTADVSLELYLITMEVTLCFGPFNSSLAAREWCGTLEQEHWSIEAREELEDEQAEEASGILTKPFLRAYLHAVDIIQADAGMRAKGELIPPKDPIVDAHQIHVYALAAFQEAITAAHCSMDNPKHCA